MSNIATQIILTAKEQLDKAIKNATSKITLLENLLEQGLGEEQLKQVIEENIENGTIGNAIFNKDNIVNTRNVTDGAITNNKINTSVNNLATSITSGKTIDTTTGELKDSASSYVTDFIQVRDTNGPIYKNLYINKWKNSLMWVGYNSDKSKVIKSGLGGTGTELQRKLAISSFSSIYYVRIIGYTDLCPATEFIVTDKEYKNIEWLKLNEDNFSIALPSYLCNSNVVTLRSDNSINLNVKSSESDSENNTITLTTNKTVMGYVNNTTTQVASSTFKLTKTVGTGDYVLIYNINLKRLQIISVTEILNYKCSVLMYLYIYKQASVMCYLLGNDSKIEVTWTHKIKDTTKTEETYVEVTEKITDKADDSVFTHNIKASDNSWNMINRVGVDRYATPYPFIFNSTMKAQGGMLVAENGLCSMYKGLDKGHGGHLFQGWGQNNQYRCTILNDNRMSDNLPITVLQNWITKGLKADTDCAYGWIHIGSDDFKIIDEVIDTDENSKVGIYVHPKVSIIGTPLILEPKSLIETMPQGYQVDSNGDYVIGDDGKRVKLELETIEGKNVLQVNENNELCFHRGDTNKWYKVNMTEITE